jgi:hypothetical protein
LVLLTNAEALDEFGVASGILALEIVEQATTLADELQQPTAGMMIFCVNLEVLGEVVDALAEECYLDFR